jgi:hypothetical protein
LIRKFAHNWGAGIGGGETDPIPVEQHPSASIDLDCLQFIDPRVNNEYTHY